MCLTCHQHTSHSIAVWGLQGYTVAVHFAMYRVWETGDWRGMTHAVETSDVGQGS
jgi:hypothetical protein